MKAPEFSDLLLVARRGDEAATADLLQRYEPYLRRAIHLRLTDPRLRRLFDTMDIYQSVAADFLNWAGSGDGAFASAEKARNFLVTMVVNKIREKARAAKNRCQGLPPGHDPVATDPSPSQQAAVKDAAAALRAKLTDHEKRLLDLRARDLSWAEIAAELGGNADALRVRHLRLITRLRKERP